MLAKRRTNRDGPRGDTPEKIVREFIRRINRRDIERLTQLMTDNHVLIDSLGHRLQGGRPAMHAVGATRLSLSGELRAATWHPQ